MDFSEQITLARAKLNLSQEALAKQLNVSFATVNRWEQGRNKPTRKAMIFFKEFCQEHNIILKENP